MTGTTLIYTLNDPRTGACRYVGKTKNPRVRYWGHFDFRSKRSPKCRWIEELISAGLKPLMLIIDEVPDAQWEFWETEYIRLFRSIGINLLNVTDGGGGYDRHTDETRLRLSEARRSRPPASEETRAKLSALHTGNKYLLGKKRSIEARMKQSTSMMGKKSALGFRHSDETRRRMSAVAKGRVFSDEHRRNLSIACALRESKKNQMP